MLYPVIEITYMYSIITVINQNVPTSQMSFGIEQCEEWSQRTMASSPTPVLPHSHERSLSVPTKISADMGSLNLNEFSLMDYSSRPPLALCSAIKTKLYKGRGPAVSHMTASNRRKYGTPSSTNNDGFVSSPVLYSTSPLITPFALDPSVTVIDPYDRPPLALYSAIKTDLYNGRKPPASHMASFNPKSICSGYFSPLLHCSTSSS